MNNMNEGIEPGFYIYMSWGDSDTQTILKVQPLIAANSFIQEVQYLNSGPQESRNIQISALLHALKEGYLVKVPGEEIPYYEFGLL